MNGYLYLPAGDRSPEPGLSRVLAGAVGPVREMAAAGGGRLLVWGTAEGDVHCSLLDSHLVLNGYISEVDSGPTLAGQQQAADYLRECLDADCSSKAVKALLCRLHGSFSIFYHHSRKGVTLGLTDRVASRPLWRMQGENEWRVSSHPMAIACAAPAAPLDLGALGAFLLYAGPIQPRKSLYAGIEACPAGTITRLGSEGVAEESSWYRFYHAPDPAPSLADWVELAAARLVRSAARIARQCPQPIVFFSGGVDSRLAAAALVAADAKPLLVTLGDARNLEVRVAERAARALGLPHVVLLRDKEWYLRTLPHTVFQTGGSFLWTHGHFARAISQLRDHGQSGVCVLGDFCEAFSKLLCAVPRHFYLPWSPEAFVAGFDQTRPPLYRPADRARTLFLLNRAVRSDVETALARDITRRYELLRESTNDPRILVDQFARWESAASIATFFMFLDVRSAAAERNLMFDRDVHELLETLPADMRHGAGLGARLVGRLAPAAGRVVNSNSLLPLTWPPAAHSLSRKFRPLLGHVRRLLAGRTHRTTGAWPEKAVLYATDPVWRSYLETIFADDGLFPRDLFDLDQVRLCWRSFLNGERERAGDIEKLAQLGLLSRLRAGWNTGNRRGPLPAAADIAGLERGRAAKVALNPQIG